MKMNKKEWHYFVLTDYEQEEEYLRRMHRQGWKFVKVKLPGIYHFEACTPEDVVYRLDFNPQDPQERESCRQFYRDYGWEYLQDMNEFSYFRKPASGVENEDQIFGDNASKLAMLKRIFSKRMLPILVVFLLCVLPAIWHLLEDGWYGVPRLILWGLYFVVCVLYIYLVGRCAIGFWRLGKKYQKK